jgi:hypothetical protein
MAHESVWNSRPRNYGKGSRAWYARAPLHLLLAEKEREEDEGKLEKERGR